MKFLSCLGYLLACLMLSALPALANARLLKATPANGARVRSPARVQLTFSEALEPAFSGALLLDKDGRNWTADPVRIDGPILRLRPSARLPAGAYTVSWHSVGHEGHRLEGQIRFTVRP
ncbi:MAG TPA: copper resistance protein CopC [Rhizomicrobium sp.]|nr:copper resistance protein CopC [Rhizomicrobium sp.]